MDKVVFSKRFRNSCRFIAKQVYGPKGIWAYEMFDFINAKYFGGLLPPTYIIWALTPHGGCFGFACTDMQRGRPPIITLHPALLGETDSPNPWKIPVEFLGPSFAFDTLLHECIHIHIDHNLGGTKGRSSHDCKRWVRQVNRIASLCGFSDVKAGRTKLIRRPDPAGPRSSRGNLPTKVVRVTLGNIPFGAVASFPQGYRMYLGIHQTHYTHQKLPAGAPRFGKV